MGQHDPRIDAYIAKSKGFARPILEHLRALVHRGCPQVEETIKWGMPYFLHHGMLCGMAAFKQHCSFGFWKGVLVVPGSDHADAMGQFGRIGSLADLPADAVLLDYLAKAMLLNEQGVKPPRGAQEGGSKPELLAPEDLLDALAANQAAQACFEAFRPSHRREYLEWILEAKTPATRARRICQAVEWMSEGKSRNWKYQNC